MRRPSRMKPALASSIADINDPRVKAFFADCECVQGNRKDIVSEGGKLLGNYCPRCHKTYLRLDDTSFAVVKPKRKKVVSEWLPGLAPPVKPKRMKREGA